MTKITRLLRSVTALCLGAGLAGSPKAAFAGEASQVGRATLANGLKVVVVRDTLAPVVTTQVNYLAGANDCAADFPGTAHAQEHMMFRGSPGLSGDQLTRMSALMGGDFNAETQQAITQYFFTVPAEDLDVALRIESARMRGVDDDEQAWSKERGAIEQEVADDMSNPTFQGYMSLRKTLFEGTPYADNGLGTRPSFDKTTAAMLKQFHDSWYAPNNAILVIAGNVDIERTIAKVREYYGDIPKRAIPNHPNCQFRPLKPQTVSIDSDLSDAIAWIAFRGPGFENRADYAALTVLADVLSSQRAELYGLVPAGKALSAGFWVDPEQHASMACAYLEYPKGQDGDALVAETKQILAKFAKDGLSPELVEAAKRREIASAEYQRTSIPALASAWSQALAVEGRESPEDDLQDIEKVTVADVNRLASQVLDLDHAAVAMLNPKPSGKPTSSHSFGGSESFASSNPKPAKLPVWAEAPLTHLAVPESAAHPEDFTLPNGLRLIVVPDHTSRTVTVKGVVKSNSALETPRGKEGAAQVLDDLFSFGTTSLDRLAFARALDDIGANESAGSDFSLQVLSGQFDRGVELLADNLLHPALPAEAFAIVRKQRERSVAGRLESPQYLADRALTKALVPPGDPERREATPQSVAGLTLADVQAYYQGVFRPDLTTIAVIGDVTSEVAQQVVTKYFGSWNAVGPQPATLLPPVPPSTRQMVVVPDSSRVQDRVALGLSFEMNRLDPDFYALQLGNAVLGGALNSTRLYKDLRQNSGLVYYVFTSLQIGLTRSSFGFEFGCDPQNVSKARSIVERDLRALRTKSISEPELWQAKAQILREITLSEGSADAIASGYLHRSLYGLPLDEPQRAARRYLKVTAPEVQSAFWRWLDEANLSQVTLGPNPQ